MKEQYFILGGTPTPDPELGQIYQYKVLATTEGSEDQARTRLSQCFLEQPQYEYVLAKQVGGTCKIVVLKQEAPNY